MKINEEINKFNKDKWKKINLMKIELEEIKWKINFKYIKIGTKIIMKKLWAIKINLSNVDLYKLIGLTIKEYIIFLREQGADCYLKINNEIIQENLYFSNYKIVIKAMEKLEAYEIMNKLCK